MQKSKLGVSIGLMGAAAFLLTYFSGYTPVLLLTGYVMLREDDAWLKKTCVKAIIVSAFFDAIRALINLIPDVLGWLYSLVNLFDGRFDYTLISNICSLCTRAFSIIELCLFLVLGLKALKQSSVNVPFVDKLLEKHF